MSTSALLYGVLAGIIPSLIWLFFWLRQDHNHPEPRYLLAATFFGGMLAVVAAIVGEQYVKEFISEPYILYTAWAAIEEVAKFVFVFIIALKTVHNDEPIDAMVYCITGALGFAALENALFILGPLSDGEVARSIVTGNMRFIGATLVHVVSSAAVGFGLGLAFYRKYASRLLLGLAGLVVAIVIHTAFNLSILNSESAEALKTFGWIWFAVVILIVLFEEVKAVHPRLIINARSPGMNVQTSPQKCE